MKKKISFVKFVGCAAAMTIGLAALAQPTPAQVMPKPRPVTAVENQQLKSTIEKQFGKAMQGKLQMRAAGPYRFVGSGDALYFTRSDLGSVAFETAAYGTYDKPLPQEDLSRERLLPAVDRALERAGLKAQGRQFAWFQDEFAGVAPKGAGTAPTDPREHSKLVARTVAFTRTIEGLPVFGSELLVGLNGDGQIGRLRLHWPTINSALVVQGRRLQAAVETKKWQLPKDLETPDTKVLEVSAGVGHSAFADPRFRAAAVVRVLVRRETKQGGFPLVSTAYKFFDARGKEVEFSAFPEIPGTARNLKRETAK